MRANRSAGSTGGTASPARPMGWFCVHLWKLPILTACTLFFGTCVAGTLSIVLRPPRPYIIPLFSDIVAHTPERHILRLSFGLASPLLLATLTACLLHARELRIARRAALAPSLIANMPSTPKATLKITPRRTSRDSGPSVASRRRISRVNTRSALFLLIVFLLGALTIALQLGVLHVGGLRRSIWWPIVRISLEWLRRQLVYNALLVYWVCSSLVLTWYFYLLQSLPVSTASSGVDEDPVRELLDAVWLPSWARASGQWLRGNMRALCVTGQAVCVIKILGLWFALKNFSISRRRLIKLGLLATLAFAEYSATVFFSFFLVVLALDIRAKVGCANERNVSVSGAA